MVLLLYDLEAGVVHGGQQAVVPASVVRLLSLYSRNNTANGINSSFSLPKKTRTIKFPTPTLPGRTGQKIRGVYSSLQLDILPNPPFIKS